MDQNVTDGMPATDSFIVVARNRHVVLDLNGKTINRGLSGGEALLNGFVIWVDGDLTITDNSTDKDGMITGGKNTGYGGGVYVYRNGRFTLEGGTINGNTAVNGGGVFVNDEGTFTMKGGTISNNTASGEDSDGGQGGGVCVNGGSFTMSGNSAIGGNEAAKIGGGVYVSGGSFTMSGNSTISGNSAKDNYKGSGGGVYVDGGTFTMNAGTITGNQSTGTSNQQGGGVYVNSGTFTMEDGTISGNEANNYCGGVYLFGGEFTMNAGTISGNSAKHIYKGSGGGVYVDGGTFTMTGGKITGNQSAGTRDEQGGGGVYVNGGEFTMNGGAISGNKAKKNGGGVYMKDGTFNLSSNADISGNKKSIENSNSNVVLAPGKVITIADKLTNANPIGVSVRDGEGSDVGGTFTSGFKAKMTDADPAKFFKSEQTRTQYEVLPTTDGKEAELALTTILTYHNNIDSDPKKVDQKVRLNAETTLKANTFTRPGYRFTGWNTSADGKGTAYADKASVRPTGSIPFYAQWEQIEVEVEAFDSKGYEYTGKAITPDVVVKDKKTGKALVKDTDYEVEYRNNVNAGDPAQAYILMKGDY